MAYVDENACRQLGIDHKKLLSIARRLETAGKDAHKLGVTVFGHSGGGTLVTEAPTQLQLGTDTKVNVGGMVGGLWDGGDPNYIEMPVDD